jgi:hypothetical protein
MSDPEPVTLTIEVDTNRFDAAMARLADAWNAVPAGTFQRAIRAWADQVALQARHPRRPRLTGRMHGTMSSPYAHRARWRGRRPKR